MAPRYDENTPVDIVYTKLLDWLVERKKIPANWQDMVREVREQVTAALTQLPDVPEITDLLKGKYLHYFHCVRILQLLEAAEQGRAKNIFGQYTSQHLRQWSSLLKAYEKDHIFLGEGARLLVQATAYACPALKKTKAQYDKQRTDCSRKVLEYAKTIADFERKLQQQCKDLGIPGLEYRSELQSLTSELPGQYSALEALLQGEGMGEALHYHRAIWALLHDTHTQAQDAEKGAEADTYPEDVFFPTIKRIRSGEKRHATATRKKGGQEGNGNEPVELDWEGNSATQQAVAEDEEVEEGSSLLSSVTVRGGVLHDLLELEAFLLQRRSELHEDEQGGMTSLVLAYTATAHSHSPFAQTLQSQNVATTDRYLESVRGCLQRLRAPRFQLLCMIKSTPGHLDRLVRGLHQQKEHLSKLQRAVQDTQQRQEEATQALSRTAPEYESLVCDTVSLKTSMEAALSKLYNGRPFHITGEVNCL